MTPLLLPLGALALLVAARHRSRVVSPGRRGPVEPPTVPGVTLDTLTPDARAFLGRLGGHAKRRGVPVTVTSTGRSYDAQAGAMLSNLGRWGVEHLRDLYRDRAQVDALLAGPRDRATWAATLAAWAARGRPLSAHLGGHAFDLRTRDLTPVQVRLLASIVERMGGRAIIEPDHMHVRP